MIKAVAVVLALVVGGLGVASAATAGSGTVISHILPTGSSGESSLDNHNGTHEVNETEGSGTQIEDNGTQGYEGQDSVVHSSLRAVM